MYLPPMAPAMKSICTVCCLNCPDQMLELWRKSRFKFSLYEEQEPLSPSEKMQFALYNPLLFPAFSKGYVLGGKN